MNNTRTGPTCRAGQNHKATGAARRGLRALPWLAIFAVIGVALGADVSLAWDARPGAAGYSVYYGAAFSGYYTAKVSVAAPGTNVTISGLRNDTKYYFAATAYANGAESDYSSEVVWHGTNWSGPLPPVLTVDGSQARALIRAADYKVFTGANSDTLKSIGVWPSFVSLPATNSAHQFYELREWSFRKPEIIGMQK